MTYISIGAAFVAAAIALPAAAQERVSIGTGGTGGVFYAIGAGMADIISNNVDGVSANAEVTGASIENIRRVSGGEMTMGFSSASTLYEGQTGTGAFDGEPQDVAAIAYLYPAILQIAATDESGAETVADVGALRVSVGPPGSNSAVLAERLLTAYGAFDMGNVSFLSYGEATAAIKNGQLDASFLLAGIPAAAFIELFTTEDVRLIPVAEEDVASLLEEYPFYETVEIPEGTYEGQEATVLAMGDPAILFTSAGADDEMVHNLTAALFDNLDTLGGAHPAAQDITVENATNTPIDLHPGAQRYFDGQ